MKVFSVMEELKDEISKIFREVLLNEEFPPSTPAQAQASAPAVKPRPTVVRFNKGTDSEYQVMFTERGFLIDDTRLSFEEIENAISKEYSLTLKSGTVIDAVKMQQILKYKGRF